MSKRLLDTRREVMKAVTREFPGGHDCAATLLSLKPKRLANQVYETAGCTPLSDLEIFALEQVTGTHHLPDYVCQLYGGVFMPLPVVEELDNVDLHSRSIDAAAKRGKVDMLIAEFLADGVIDKEEAEEILAVHRKYLAARSSEVHATLALYGKQDA
ncbi:YmfL family putative regulatory protein [Pseudomonas sp. JS3066]|uniref:YmfL family putative regulatory protein n=1 Tax=Pseudomonas sp. JS3066 TaxID=3090665 RepID=UPI002E7B1F70|nr:YmfL family putative regulatory protein [Pseudomonas sp. JS3066]WVK90919.1 YmfL family putative regulatory protein [Pseudomonas sp. JS3066]